jgi:hypothetical protein
VIRHVLSSQASRQNAILDTMRSKRFEVDMLGVLSIGMNLPVTWASSSWAKYLMKAIALFIVFE